MLKVNKEFNFAMPKVVKEKKVSFAKSELDPSILNAMFVPDESVF